MDYAAVIRDAWRLTWRNRFLWILGLFAGGAVGGWTSPSMGLRFNPSDVNSDYASLAPAFAESGRLAFGQRRSGHRRRCGAGRG